MQISKLIFTIATLLISIVSLLLVQQANRQIEISNELASISNNLTVISNNLFNLSIKQNEWVSKLAEIQVKELNQEPNSAITITTFSNGVKIYALNNGDITDDVIMTLDIMDDNAILNRTINGVTYSHISIEAKTVKGNNTCSYLLYISNLLPHVKKECLLITPYPTVYSTTANSLITGDNFTPQYNS